MTISVIVPVHKHLEELDILRAMIGREKNAELILVLQDNISIRKKHSREVILISNTKGRGNNFVKGIRKASGDVLLLLHSDTVLPKGWFQIISETMSDSKIVGGAFHLSFDNNHPLLKILIVLSDWFFFITGELWGDRAMFVRADLLKENLHLIDVPIMEDVLLSHFLKRKGKVKLVKAKVITNADKFIKRSMAKHLLKILKCRTAHFLKRDLQKIYAEYYS